MESKKAEKIMFDHDDIEPQHTELKKLVQREHKYLTKEEQDKLVERYLLRFIETFME